MVERSKASILVTNKREIVPAIYNMSVSLEPNKIKELPWLVATFKKKKKKKRKQIGSKKCPPLEGQHKIIIIINVKRDCLSQFMQIAPVKTKCHKNKIIRSSGLNPTNKKSGKKKT